MSCARWGDARTCISGVYLTFTTGRKFLITASHIRHTVYVHMDTLENNWQNDWNRLCCHLDKPLLIYVPLRRPWTCILYVPLHRPWTCILYVPLCRPWTCILYVPLRRPWTWMRGPARCADLPPAAWSAASARWPCCTSRYTAPGSYCTSLE